MAKFKEGDTVYRADTEVEGEVKAVHEYRDEPEFNHYTVYWFAGGDSKGYWSGNTEYNVKEYELVDHTKDQRLERLERAIESLLNKFGSTLDEFNEERN